MAAQAPAQDNHAEDRMQQMDPAMEQCVDAMPADMRDEARQMHLQMHPMMQQMMSGPDGMGEMGRMGDPGMGSMRDGSGVHSGDAAAGDEPRDSDG